MDTTKGYVDTEYLQTTGNFLGKLKARTYSCMQIKEGDKVLDVGCGTGIDTMALSQFVGPKGQVYGVDYDPAMVLESENHAEKAGMNARVKHKHADAASLPFDAEYFDSCRSERLFQHLTDPVKALSEMVRVTKANGTIVVLDADWGSLSTDNPEVDVEQRLAHFFAEQMLNNGFSGRQLFGLFKKQGLQNITFEIYPIVVTNYGFWRQMVGADEIELKAVAENIITEIELHRYQVNLEQAEAEGRFFSYCCMTLVTGQKNSQVGT